MLTQLRTFSQSLAFSCCVVTIAIITVVSGEPLKVQPSYDEIIQKLDENIKAIYSDDIGLLQHDDVTRITQKTGKLFTKDLVEKGTEGIVKLMVTEEGKSLPTWLVYHPENNQLQGLPLRGDIGSYKIQIDEIDVKTKKVANTRFLKIAVVKTDVPFMCKDKPMTTGHIVVNADLSMPNYRGQPRVDLLRNLFGLLNKDAGNKNHVNNVHIEQQGTGASSWLESASMLLAGPGESEPGTEVDAPKLIFSWQLKCDIASPAALSSDSVINNVKSISRSAQGLHKLLQVSMDNWYVMTHTNNAHIRYRRAVAGRTPAATPGVQPTRAATPGIKPSSSSVFVKPSVIPATLPPTTKPPTQPPTPPTQKVTQPPIVPITKPVNRAPEVIKELEIIDGTVNVPMIYSIPSNTFYDPDGDELDIKLQMEGTAGNVDVKSDSWIQFNVDGQNMMRFCVFPRGLKFGADPFIQTLYFLNADDRNNHDINDAFKVKVFAPDHYATTFNLTLETKPMLDTCAKVDFILKLEKILDKTNKVNNQYTKSRMHIVRFEPNTKTGTTLLVWGREGYNNTCNDIQFANYRDTLLSNRFKSDVEQSGFRVIETGAHSTDGGCVMPVVVVHDDSWWQKVMIPVIIIVIVLLIIALILCCVYRRRRKAHYKPEEESGFLAQKKPIIFLEEYEDKPDFVSLQPLDVPNPKPAQPIQDTRSASPGPDSSTVSTESDGFNEKQQLVPNTPKQASKFSAPPPYSAH